MAEFAGKYDYIIVGAGTAGCVLANRLTQDKDISVLLLEAGAKDDYGWVHIPIGFLRLADNPRTDWQYRTEANPGLNGRSLLYPSGKVLGGSSSINGMIYQRGQARDYDRWAELTGDESWSWDQVLPIFKKSEHCTDGIDEFHGRDGDWHVESQQSHWDILDAFQDAAAEHGVPKIADFNRGTATEGCGYFAVNQKNGLRLNTAKAFLRTITRRGNLDIMTGSHVQRLIVRKTEQGNVCSGVEFVGGGRVWTADVSRETILCAGTVGSPQILQQSGIGPADLLCRFGIAPLQDLPGVGENLQDRLALNMVFKIRDAKSLNTLTKSWLGKASLGLQYLIKREGALTTIPKPMGAMLRSDPTLVAPDLFCQIQPWSQRGVGAALDTFPGFTIAVSNLTPLSRGRVQIACAEANAAPAITTNYLSAPEDQEMAKAAIDLIRKITNSLALKPYGLEEVQVDNDLLRYAENIAVAGADPVGTCKMGRVDDTLAVVDSQLRVVGMAGLRVADASVMPMIPAGDTGASTIMIAEKAASLIRASR